MILSSYGKGLVLESRFSPNRVSNPTEIASFESPPNSFVHRERSDSRPRQKLVRRHSPNSIFLIAPRFVVVVVVPPLVPSVLIAENLRPVRHVHRKRHRSTDAGGRSSCEIWRSVRIWQVRES
ncbi:hypothetical protein glysoja_021097 [Glycine soja]|nr:hypothetical protein glysoja_021097 [Glycine soja]